MNFATENLSKILLLNLILTIILVSIVFVMAGLWIWSQIQGIRSELRSGQENAKVFPGFSEKATAAAVPQMAASPKPASSLQSKFTAASDFVTVQQQQQTLLDKKVFAVAGSSMKSSTGGLKDLI